MIDGAKAYLKTQGNLEYRDCKIFYYTYSMFDKPEKFRVNVNVKLHHAQNDYTKSLNMDEDFEKEQAAIEHGVKQGKQFIDSAYNSGKISVVKTMQTPTKERLRMEKTKVEKK